MKPNSYKNVVFFFGIDTSDTLGLPHQKISPYTEELGNLKVGDVVELDWPYCGSPDKKRLKGDFVVSDITPGYNSKNDKELCVGLTYVTSNNPILVMKNGKFEVFGSTIKQSSLGKLLYDY